MSTSKRIAVVGGGHNGLVCAFYLARAGHAVDVFEARGVVGGAAVTETFHPGFRNSTASYTVSLLHEQIISDMKLKSQYGLRILERPISNFLPLDDRSFLKVGGGLARTQAEVAKFSTKDAAALPGYFDALDGVANVLRDLALRTPPNVGNLTDSWTQIPWLAGRLKHLSLEQRRNTLDLFSQSASDFLDRWFESTPIKAAFGFDSIVGHFASPHTPGSAYVLLHHCFGGVNGKPGIWGHAVGGMGAITQAMAKACEDAGVKIHLDSPVAEILTQKRGDKSCAVGIKTRDGRIFDADAVAANVHPKILYERLLSPADQLDDFRRRIAHYKSESGTFRMNVALSELPRFTCLPEPGEHHASGIIMAPSIAFMDAAYTSARTEGFSSNPIVEILIPSTVDNSLAPAGAHVASLFCQHFPYAPSNGKSWDDLREAAAERIIDTVNEYAPNFKQSVLGRMALAPTDLEKKFGLIGGDIFHGHMSLDQLWTARPMLGHGHYRAPVQGLYMCGSGTHPGGGVSGQPGYNAAREILRDSSLRTRISLALRGQ